MDEIQKIRTEIDRIDTEIIDLLRQRGKNVSKIGKLKASKKLSITDLEREKEVISRLDSDYERNIFQKIIKESKKLQ